MNNIDYALELFSRIPFQYRYDREDSLASVISLMAYEHAQFGDFDGFKTIITHPRFTDYCGKNLFYRFFTSYSYDSLPNPHLDIKKETVNLNLDKALSIFLELNKTSFGVLYKEHRSEYYYLIDPESSATPSLSRIDLLLNYVIENKIYISALSLDIEQLMYFEDINLEPSFKEKIQNYADISKNDKNTQDLIGHTIFSSVDLNHEIEARIPFENREKRNVFEKMLLIGFYFDKNKVIGEKDTSYEIGDCHYCQSEPYFKQGVPDVFNNPYTEFSQCFTLLANVMEVDFSEEEKALALTIYQDIHKNHYKYD